jgi:hypothetical protein
MALQFAELGITGIDFKSIVGQAPRLPSDRQPIRLRSTSAAPKRLPYT